MVSTLTEIDFRQVTFAQKQQSLVQSLTFQVQVGEVFVLLGRSGCGKTTTLKLMNGLLLPTQGTVTVKGCSTRDWDLIALRRQMGYVIQDIGLFPHLTVEQNVGVVPSLLGWSNRKKKSRTYELLEQVGLPSTLYAGRYPTQLSGGQRQRVGVARALAADPSILLLDEPFGALDPVTRFEVQELFISLQQSLKKTVILITHDIQEALRMGDRIGLMNAGELVAITNADDFMTLDHPVAMEFQRTVLHWAAQPVKRRTFHD